MVSWKKRLLTTGPRIGVNWGPLEMAARFFVSKLDTFPGGVGSRAKRSGAVRRFLALLEPSPCAVKETQHSRRSAGAKLGGSLAASGHAAICPLFLGSVLYVIFPYFFPLTVL